MLRCIQFCHIIDGEPREKQNDVCKQHAAPFGNIDAAAKQPEVCQQQQKHRNLICNKKARGFEDCQNRQQDVQRKKIPAQEGPLQFLQVIRVGEVHQQESQEYHQVVAVASTP